MADMDAIYRQYARTVQRYLLSLTRNETLAEELTQETFYQAVRSIGRFDGSCAVSTWLCAIAKNVLLAYRRKHPPTDDSALEGLSVPSVESEALRREEALSLYRSLHALPEQTREVMYLRLFGGLSFAEIGEVLGKSDTWARVTYYRGKEKVKKEVENNG